MGQMFASPDTEALSALLATMRPRLRAILIRHAIPPADAEDLVQDTFLALCVSWERIENQEAWVSGTLRFLCCNYWRKKKRQCCESMDTAVLESLPELSTYPQSRSDVVLDLEALVAKLKPRYRHLLRLRYGLGMSSAELTVRLGYSADHVRKLTSRALARARCLGQEAQRAPQSGPPAQPRQPRQPRQTTRTPNRAGKSRR